jgi:anti-sigma factor RsiW
MRKDDHLNERDLLMAADGELSSRRIAKIRAHLSVCQRCRARKGGLEGALEDLHAAHQDLLDSQLRASSGSRALFKARLAETAANEFRSASEWRFLQAAPLTKATAAICLLCLVAVTASRTLFPDRSAHDTNIQMAAIDRGAVPDRSLTPGFARKVSLGEVCAMAHEDVEREVPDSLRRQVFQEYGIATARAEDYEVDYLIAPSLGGAEDIHNLWPEPYGSETWNAHVKDALEEHLHQVVCGGEVDLRTAQNDISTDWIAAYKKYFHTDTPVSTTAVTVDGDFLGLSQRGVVRASLNNSGWHFPS